MPLNEHIAQELTHLHKKLVDTEKLPTHRQLDLYYDTFSARFGPERLMTLDGEALLSTMHDHFHTNRNTMVYWLEFKNDEEFPSPIFGSISGGSALKFGLFRRKETGEWNTRDESNYPKPISFDEALEIARTHRQQLIDGANLLATLPEHADDQAYVTLQERMNALAPRVSDLAWGHKYFHLLFPTKLDDFHTTHFQHFHLLKLLQVPPDGDGRYLSAGRFVDIADQLGIPMNHLTRVLNERNGRPYRYWRIGTVTDDQDLWPLMQQNSTVALGWSRVGDLTQYDSKPKLKTALEDAYYGSDVRTASRKAGEIFNFSKAAIGDVVLACNGLQVRGIGKITGDYQHIYDDFSEAPHRRSVEWLSFDEWRLPQQEGLQTSFVELKQVPNLIQAEQQIIDLQDTLEVNPAPTRRIELDGIQGRIQKILERKGQVILYGPPGTGKTYWAEATVKELAARSIYGEPFAQLNADAQTYITGNGDSHIRICTFHPAYGYEDFLEGYRPQAADDGSMTFSQQPGLFKRLCLDAARHPEYPYYLIIDEINRGDIPRIFGELLTVLEKDKRGKQVLLPISGQPFVVPPNVYIIGTMNTADRSIALLDTALRRRFGFLEFMPQPELLQEAVVSGIPLGPWLDSLNRRIVSSVGRDARNLQIGHAYLMDGGQPIRDFARFARVVQEDIIPLLEEYCYEDYLTLEKILGHGLVDAKNQRIRHELFDLSREADLVSALLEPSPELSTRSEVVNQDTQDDVDEGEEA